MELGRKRSNTLCVKIIIMIMIMFRRCYSWSDKGIVINKGLEGLGSYRCNASQRVVVVVVEDDAKEWMIKRKMERNNRKNVSQSKRDVNETQWNDIESSQWETRGMKYPCNESSPQNQHTNASIDWYDMNVTINTSIHSNEWMKENFGMRGMPWHAIFGMWWKVFLSGKAYLLFFCVDDFFLICFWYLWPCFILYLDWLVDWYLVSSIDW